MGSVWPCPKVPSPQATFLRSDKNRELPEVVRQIMDYRPLCRQAGKQRQPLPRPPVHLQENQNINYNKPLYTLWNKKPDSIARARVLPESNLTLQLFTCLIGCVGNAIRRPICRLRSPKEKPCCGCATARSNGGEAKVCSGLLVRYLPSSLSPFRRWPRNSRRR